MSGDQDTAGSKLTIGSSDPRIIYHNRTIAGGTRVQVWDKGLLWEGYGPTVTYATTTDNRGWAEFRFPEPAVGFEYWGLRHGFVGTYNICVGQCMSNTMPVVDAQGPVGPPALLYSANFDSPQSLLMSLTNRDSPQMDIVSLVLILPDSVSVSTPVAPTPRVTSSPVSAGLTGISTRTTSTETTPPPLSSSIPTSPTSQSSQTSQPSTSSSGLSSTFLGAIIGAALGATLICCIVFFLFYRYHLARRRTQASLTMTPFSSGGAGAGDNSAPHMSQHESISPFISPLNPSSLPSKIRLDASHTSSNSSTHSTSPLHLKSSMPNAMPSNGTSSHLPLLSNLRHASPTSHPNPSSNSSLSLSQNPPPHSHPHPHPSANPDPDGTSTILDSQIHGPKSVNSLFPFMPPARRDIDAGSLSLGPLGEGGVDDAVLLPPAYQAAWGARSGNRNRNRRLLGTCRRSGKSKLTFGGDGECV
ncbi:hypothetical protein BJ165DRAFT_1406581 [Panaeolus papilionaceus]|nr:hypothetical protein BJ165DRAFT_1406581 [Panaeolus papilionaceus]